MQKLVSLVFLFSILSCNFSVFAAPGDLGACQSDFCGQCEPENKNNGDVCGKENAGATCEKDKGVYSCQFSRVVKAVLATGIVLGTFAGAKIANSLVNTFDSKLLRFAGKTLVGVVGACASIASIINAGSNLGEVSKAAYYGDTSKINQFCFGLNAVNVVAALYTLKYIVSGQVFSGNSLKISIGL